MNCLSERAVLMRLSIGLPGEARQDNELTTKVKASEHMGEKSGRWVKSLYPAEALDPIKKLDTKARAFHETVTLPFDKGIGILPAALIAEHGDRMRQFAGERKQLVEAHFLARYDEWVAWARKEHNGTFDASLYAGVDALREKFYFRTEPLPVPDATHFQSTVASLLGTDVDSVNARVSDATKEAHRELMSRLIAPVEAMAKKLSEKPKDGREDIVFRDTLISNLQDIVKLAPKLNITGDPAIDAFVVEVGKLTTYTATELRENKNVRGKVATEADAMFKKLSGYKLG